MTRRRRLATVRRVNFLAGVDEAGLGPILGPLVVAGVAMAGPAGADPWRALRGQVSRRKHVKGKVRVADSKKVNQGPQGRQRLEETALVFWTARHGSTPATLREWLEQLGADLPQLSRCPWYEDLDLTLPLAADPGLVELRGAVVARALGRHGIELLDLAVRPVDVEEWNGLIADTDNKSRAHFHAYAEVLGRILDRVPAAPPAAGGEGDSEGDAPARRQLVADRCGGRMHYEHDLRRLRPRAEVEIVLETPAVSSYLLREQGSEITVTFAERGEERAFPTALASCFAKYLRELMVEVLNRWFCARIPGLKPTAGYYVDGHRFLDDVLPQVEALALPRERLVRVR
ncbi:MAG: hypothetical protein KDE27_21010 [Planctomycetes bacterium]|nr:hypothetical protein [Planctomycetota bacterium]